MLQSIFFIAIIIDAVVIGKLGGKAANKIMNSSKNGKFFSKIAGIAAGIAYPAVCIWLMLSDIAPIDIGFILLLIPAAIVILIGAIAYILH